jgi:hypothetical protein
VVLISTPRISALLCGSAVILLYSTFTAETTRNAEIRREDLESKPPPVFVNAYRFPTERVHYATGAVAIILACAMKIVS